MDFFSVVGVLAPNAHDAALLFQFVRPALRNIEQSYADFTGKSLRLLMPPLFRMLPSA
jgi:hypothetical protein